MNSAFQKTALCLFIAALAFTSCKKDKLSPEEILAAGTCWKMVLIEGYDTANNLWAATPVDDCSADDCFTFHADQSLTVEEGATKCDPNDPQTSVGSWSVSDDGKKLTFSDDSATEVGVIVELSTGKLVIEQSFDNEKVRVTMKADQ